MASTLRNLALAALPLSVSAVPLFSRGSSSAPVKLQKRAYSLSNRWSGDNFFSGFDFFTDGDPTHGSVTYVQDDSLAFVSGGNAIMKVDNSSDVASGGPRNSVRITSKEALNEGSLVVMTANHYPFGCSVWPAFWMTGLDWPAQGEIDIWEGVNKQATNQATLHTTAGCSHDPAAEQSGKTLQEDCNWEVNGNAGCGVQDSRDESYGDELNGNGGGTFATLWDSNGIKTWFWPGGSAPGDAKGDSPDPSGWGTPLGNWPFTTCQSSFFKDLHVVFDITLCGDWAGQDAVFQQTGCSGTCADAVASAANFGEAYFSVESVATYHA